MKIIRWITIVVLVQVCCTLGQAEEKKSLRSVAREASTDEPDEPIVRNLRHESRGGKLGSHKSKEKGGSRRSKGKGGSQNYFGKGKGGYRGNKKNQYLKNRGKYYGYSTPKGTSGQYQRPHKNPPRIPRQGTVLQRPLSS